MGKIGKMGGDKDRTPLPTSTLSFVSILFFLVEFGTGYTGYSLETVYITPFFIRLETPWLLDSFIWLAPALLLVVLAPLYRLLQDFAVFSDSVRMLCYFHLGSAITGITLLIVAYMLGDVYQGEDTSSVLLLAFLGFLVMDVELMTLETLAVDLLTSSEHSRHYCAEWSSGWKHFGRVTAYLLASLDALQLGIVQIYSVSPYSDHRRYHAIRTNRDLGPHFPHTYLRSCKRHFLPLQTQSRSDSPLELLPSAEKQSFEAANPLPGSLLQLRSVPPDHCVRHIMGWDLYSCGSSVRGEIHTAEESL